MKLTTSSPTKSYISDYSSEDLYLLRKTLTYTNTSIKHLISRHYKNVFWKSRNPDSWEFHLEGLKKDLKRCLVFEDEQGIYIRPGSISYVADLFADLVVENTIKYPAHKKMAWKKPLAFELRPEQTITWEGFLRDKHANASLCTGFGKSAIILKACREIGLNTCIVVPSKSIFEELIEVFEKHLGKSFVGAIGAGKRKLGKKITIAIGDSLAHIEPGSEEYNFFNSLDVLIVDESHEFAAESLETVCHGILSNIPYRFFLSATQMRNDGSGPLLQSIIGPTICTLTTAEAVKKGYVCHHDFRIVSVESSNPGFEATDPLEVKREIFLKNKNIGSFSAKLANAMAAQGKGTLILVEELSQISMLVPLMKVPFAIAHSEKGKERLAELGIDKVNNAESVEKFNKGEVKVLIGTSCIATGTNIFPCHNVVNWVGGASPIKTKQGSVGRAVRHGHSNPWASKCYEKIKATIWDFDVESNYTLTRHLEARMECYKESGTEIKYIRLKT